MKFNSITELCEAFGLTKKPRRERGFTCRKCGKEMRRIDGTNVVLCECGNHILTRYVPYVPGF